MPDDTGAETPQRHAEPLDLVAFLVTAVASFVLRWDLTELVWGLWLSSLLVGYAMIVYGIFAAVARPIPLGEPSPGAKPDLGAALGALPGDLGVMLELAGALFLLAFFTVHFGGFHFVHGIFLGLFFPLASVKPGPDAVLANAQLAFQSSWPLVLTTAVSMRHAFTQARHEFKPITPYASVIRMHVLIFVFAGAKAVHFDNRWLYIVVLFFYFFPFRFLRRLWQPTTSS